MVYTILKDLMIKLITITDFLLTKITRYKGKVFQPNQTYEFIEIDLISNTDLNLLKYVIIGMSIEIRCK